MDAKQKAKELVEQFKKDKLDVFYYDSDGFVSVPTLELTQTSAKKLALIAVDEILKLSQKMPDDMGIHFVEYWHEVKKEI